MHVIDVLAMVLQVMEYFFFMKVIMILLEVMAIVMEMMDIGIGFKL